MHVARSVQRFRDNDMHKTKRLNATRFRPSTKAIVAGWIWLL